MFNIHIIAVGKLKESYWQDAAQTYIQRLQPYAKLDITEIKEEPFRDGDDREKIKEKEAQKIEKHLQQTDVVIAMHEVGKEFSSVEFSSFLEKQSEQGQRLVFIIGGSLGLHPSLLDRANTQLSLSAMTFPHQLAQVVLLEQLYRAATIAAGKIYHY